jgi:hypothetical protein
VHLKIYLVFNLSIGVSMKFCYIDESGTGNEPHAAMVGIVVDALHKRPAKTGWDKKI